jgi:hypothetical protein
MQVMSRQTFAAHLAAEEIVDGGLFFRQLSQNRACKKSCVS